ncbi:MAG: hypothetical protein JWL75_717 [Parcubacteria group bacterium]|nr:hypothetical protein [Parcubacteria group bacterium]
MESFDQESPQYPERLRHIPHPPERLWSVGALPISSTKTLAVVGSRALSSYGRHACENLIAGLEGYDVSIISGLAFGADACAHRAAMRAGLHTIAIPGSGLAKDVLYPKSHLELAEDIVTSGGALLSEHEPNYQARQYDFPSRNRIMVGMADVVLMIEAGERSGTLITAGMAGEYNRHLLCIPHRIGDAHGFGAQVFLRLGATPVFEPNHILEALGILPRASDEQKRLPLDLSQNEVSILALLDEPKTRDEILRVSELPAHEALSVFGMLELKGIIVEEFGVWRRA